MQAENSYLDSDRLLPTTSPMDAVRKLILEKVPNLSEVSKKIGRNHAYLQQFIKREIPKTLPEDVREALAAVINVSANELRGDRKMPRILPSDGERGNEAAITAEKPKKIEQPERAALEVVPAAGLSDKPICPCMAPLRAARVPLS